MANWVGDLLEKVIYVDNIIEVVKLERKKEVYEAKIDISLLGIFVFIKMISPKGMDELF